VRPRAGCPWRSSGSEHLQQHRCGPLVPNSSERPSRRCRQQGVSRCAGRARRGPAGPDGRAQPPSASFQRGEQTVGGTGSARLPSERARKKQTQCFTGSFVTTGMPVSNTRGMSLLVARSVEGGADAWLKTPVTADEGENLRGAILEIACRHADGSRRWPFQLCWSESPARRQNRQHVSTTAGSAGPADDAAHEGFTIIVLRNSAGPCRSAPSGSGAARCCRVCRSHRVQRFSDEVMHRRSMAGDQRVMIAVPAVWLR